MARLGLAQIVEFIAGYDSGFGAKPAAGPVLAFVRAIGVEAHEVAVVGDSIEDLVAARAAGAVAVGVRSARCRRAARPPCRRAHRLDRRSAGVAGGAVICGWMFIIPEDPQGLCTPIIAGCRGIRATACDLGSRRRGTSTVQIGRPTIG